MALWMWAATMANAAILATMYTCHASLDFLVTKDGLNYENVIIKVEDYQYDW